MQVLQKTFYSAFLDGIAATVRESGDPLPNRTETRCSVLEVPLGALWSLAVDAGPFLIRCKGKP